MVTYSGKASPRLTNDEIVERLLRQLRAAELMRQLRTERLNKQLSASSFDRRAVSEHTSGTSNIEAILQEAAPDRGPRTAERANLPVTPMGTYSFETRRLIFTI